MSDKTFNSIVVYSCMAAFLYLIYLEVTNFDAVNWLLLIVCAVCLGIVVKYYRIA